MDEIIRAEYIKHYGDCPNGHLGSLTWVDGLQDFMFAWNACEEWLERQNMMDKDYQERVQEEARLVKGE